ncbi:MAG TPA: hydrogenase [Mycolicibacterium fallax]|nr:hydrogenase [Mycolicibacterium fallax]HSA39197.1 hydrogenase [Mycobacterium sp.]
MQTALFELGLALFLLGLLTGLAIPAMKNPRMGLSSHLEAVLNGMFLVLLGLLWPHVELTPGLGLTAVVLIGYAAYANWLATLLGAVWGAGRRFAPIATGEHRASSARERIVEVLLASLAVAIIIGVILVMIGLA